MKKLFFCTHKVNRSSIRRENRKGIEHVIVTSFTLPPDIVMNGGLYASEEIDKSFESLNRTPVTVEHPEIDGDYVSANDPEIDFDFRFGAFNENARKLDDGRIALDKVINVQKAMKTEKGKRLLDRIEEIETNDKARPIHTSVGVFLTAEPLDNPVVQVNGPSKGQKYDWIAKDMVFDHDAILLDSVGASTPDQGTGIGINAEKITVSHFVVNELSFDEIGTRLQRALEAKFDGVEEAPRQWVRYDSIKSSSFVYEEDGKLFKSAYEIDENENIIIQDLKIEVRLKSEYEPVQVADKPTEDNAMRDTVIDMLSQLGITVNADVSDDDLKTQLEDALTANKVVDKTPEVNQDLVDTVKDQASKILSLEDKLKANADKDIDEKVKVIAACSKFKSLPESAIKAIAANSAEDFETMYKSSIPSRGIGPTNFEINNDVDDKMFAVNVGSAE